MISFVDLNSVGPQQRQQALDTLFGVVNTEMRDTLDGLASKGIDIMPKPEFEQILTTAEQLIRELAERGVHPQVASEILAGLHLSIDKFFTVVQFATTTLELADDTVAN